MIVNRYARSNNPLIPGYDNTQPTSYISYFDCTNLYGTSMIEKLPLCDFRFLDEDEISSFDVMSLDPKGDTGYFIECDLLYPPELHDQHSDLPLCPNHLEITREILSDVSIQLGEKAWTKIQTAEKTRTNSPRQNQIRLPFIQSPILHPARHHPQANPSNPLVYSDQLVEMLHRL